MCLSRTDFITTTFLHFWLNWVAHDDWWGLKAWGYYIHQKDNIETRPRVWANDSIPNLAIIGNFTLSNGQGRHSRRFLWGVKSIPRGTTYHWTVGCIEPPQRLYFLLYRCTRNESPPDRMSPACKLTITIMKDHINVFRDRYDPYYSIGGRTI